MKIRILKQPVKWWSEFPDGNRSDADHVWEITEQETGEVIGFIYTERHAGDLEYVLQLRTVWRSIEDESWIFIPYDCIFQAKKEARIFCK